MINIYFKYVETEVLIFYKNQINKIFYKTNGEIIINYYKIIKNYLFGPLYLGINILTIYNK